MAKDWTQALLNKRYVGDKWADRLVEEVVASGGDELSGEAKMGQFISRIVSVHDTVPDDLPQDMKDYFLKEDKPAWVEPDRLLRGTDLFMRHGASFSVVLMCASLPACYADGPGVYALDMTHQLTKHPLRRVIETTRFVMGVLQPGNLSDNAIGAITAKKIRLLHATNRYALSHQPPGVWNDKEWGAPLNQEDLALTLMTFSPVVLDSLAKLDLEISPQEAEDYVHTWRYIGYLMGIDEELLPENVEDSHSLYKTIADRVYMSSPPGIALTKAIVEMMQDLLPGEVMDGVVPAKIRLFMGDEVSDMLGVEKVSPHAITQHLHHVVRLVHGLEHKIMGDRDIFGPAADALGRLLFAGLEEIERKDHRPQFHVPDPLRMQWNLAARNPASHSLALVTGTTQPVPPADEMLATAGGSGKKGGVGDWFRLLFRRNGK